MKTNRLDSTQIQEEELKKLSEVMRLPDTVLLVNHKGVQAELPSSMVQHLLNLVKLLRKGKSITLIPEDDTFTTQAAANYLGVSRQFLVNLLESNAIPFHHVGSHRRIYFSDLLAYEKQRSQSRKAAINRLSDQAIQAGVYFSDYKGED